MEEKILSNTLVASCSSEVASALPSPNTETLYWVNVLVCIGVLVEIPELALAAHAEFSLKTGGFSTTITTLVLSTT